jgi:hypothetical protein
LEYPKAGFFNLAIALADRAYLRSLPGGTLISDELLVILALVVFEDYELFPARRDAGSKTD